MHPPTDVVPLAGEPDGGDPVVARLRALGSVPVPPAVAAAHLGAIDARPSRPSRRGPRRRHALVAGVVAGGLLLGSTSLAAAGVLPAPAQTAMSTTLGRLGIEVPATRRAPDDDGATRRAADVPGRAIAARAGDGGADRLRPARPGRADGARRADQEGAASRPAAPGSTARASAARPSPSDDAPPRPTSGGAPAGTAADRPDPTHAASSSAAPPTRPSSPPTTTAATTGGVIGAGPGAGGPAAAPTVAGAAGSGAAQDDGAPPSATGADGRSTTAGSDVPTSDGQGAP